MNTMRLAALVVALATTSGCHLDSLATQYPQIAPYVSRPAPSPIDMGVGNITGFVYGASGKAQPIPLAFVTTGSVSAFAGNPDKAKAIQEANEFDNDADATKAHLDVFHDFNDGAGPVETDRIIRKNVPAADPNADDAVNARRQYVYLRTGEFFLEGVPEGVAQLKASFGNVASTANPVTVYKNQLVTGVNLNLYIPEPVTLENGVPHVVEWTGMKPEVGISVSAQVKTTKTDLGVETDTTITYKPDPPDVAVTLKAPPGSAGAVIKAVDVIYVYNTPARSSTGQPPIQIGPVRIPVPPQVIAPAQDIAFGPPTVLTVPVGSSTLRSVFKSEDPDQQPGLIVANMEFIDDQGFAIQDKSFQNLQVSAVMRSL
jgi:hypothetical protein